MFVILGSIIDATIDCIFEALYIFSWFLLLWTIFYKEFIVPLKRKQTLLNYAIYTIRNKIISYKDLNKQLTIQLLEIQEEIQLITHKLEKKHSKKRESNHEDITTSNISIELPPQKDIIFPHFFIITTSNYRDPTIGVISNALANLLDLIAGTALPLEDVKKKFIIYIQNNKLVKNDIIILNSSLMNLFNITHNNYKLKLSDCETYIKPHLKNIHC
jgi:hypothetical protein